MVRAKPICKLDDIPDGGEAGITAKINGKKVALIALRSGDRVTLYINSCPHIGSPLDLAPGKFLDVDGKYILCSTHGALFEPDTGLCIHGPCIEQSLEAVGCRVENAEVWPA